MKAFFEVIVATVAFTWSAAFALTLFIGPFVFVWSLFT